MMEEKEEGVDVNEPQEVSTPSPIYITAPVYVQLVTMTCCLLCAPANTTCTCVSSETGM
jgi:hypothetical protein